jgi:hypothetical protein
VVARFNDFRSDATAGEFTATIDWGDGTISSGTVSLDPTLNNPDKLDPVFDVTGTHTFDKPGAYPILVTVTDSRGLNPQSNIDLSHALNSQAEGSIAVNPTNPKQLFAVSVDGSGVARTSSGGGGLFSAISMDGGATWVSQELFVTSDGSVAQPPAALGDPRAVFDQFGNLFLTYVDSTSKVAVVALSTDGGRSFRRVGAAVDAIAIDQPAIAVGPDTSGGGSMVWVSFERDAGAGHPSTIAIMGARVGGKLGPNDRVTFTQPVQVAKAAALASEDTSHDFMGLAVGPNGEVVITFKQPALVSGPSAIFAVSDPNGISGIGTFLSATPVQIATVNLGGGVGSAQVPADARGVGGETDLVWDRTRGDNGRLYLVYTDSVTVAAPNTVDTNIFLRFSNDGGATWSAPIQVNNDPPGASQFLPSLALDPTSGDIGVGWYDTRIDSANNILTQYFVAVSNDGGRTFASNLPVSVGSSNAKAVASTTAPGGFDFGDYSGIAFLNGQLHPVWADNSAALLGNPAPLSGAFRQDMDLATATVGVVDVRGAQLTVTPVAVNGTEATVFRGTVATFTSADPTLFSTDFTATIDWGDGSGGPVAADTILPTATPNTYSIIGTHTYLHAGAYPITVTVTDTRDNITANSVENVSERQLDQSETTVAINPKDASQIFIASNDEAGIGLADAGTGGGLFTAISTDGGANWLPRIIGNGTDGLPASSSDPKAVFDDLGNLFLTYLDAESNVVVAVSSDGGRTFAVSGTFAGSQGGATDQPSITTGPGQGGTGEAVWVTYVDSDTLQIVAAGAPVARLGEVGHFVGEMVAGQDQSGAERNFGDVSVGPKGQVLVTWQEPSTDSGPSQLFVGLDPDGLGPKAFGAPIVAASINVGGFTPIDPQANRLVAAEANLAWDRSSGPYAGRVYLAYMDASFQGNSQTNIFVRSSDDNGATWSAPVQVNPTSDAGSQFLPGIALDESSGALAIGWYSASGDPNGVKSQFELAASIDGGASFSPMAVASLGASDASDPKLDDAGQSNQFGDYTGIAFAGGILATAWTDNSAELPSIPDRPNFDIAAARLGIAQIADAPLTNGDALDVSPQEGENFTKKVASFKDSDPNATDASIYSVSIDWGDHSKSTSADGSITVTANSAGGFDVTANHVYNEEGSFDAVITVRDRAGAKIKITNTIEVDDGKLTGAGVDFKPLEGQAFRGVVGTFTDEDPDGAVPDYTALIDWGDGTVTDGVITTAGSASLAFDPLSGTIYAIGNFFDKLHPGLPNDPNNPGNPDNGTPYLFTASAFQSGGPIFHPVMKLGSGFNGGLAFLQNSSPAAGINDAELFAIRNDDAGTSSLYRIDLQTFTADDTTVPGGGTLAHLFDIGHGFTGGLAIDATNGGLYAIARDDAGSSALYRIDAAGAVTAQAALGNKIFSGLTYNGAGFTAIGSDLDGLSSLYRITPSGNASLELPLGQGFSGGLAFVPNPFTAEYFAIQGGPTGRRHSSTSSPKSDPWLHRELLASSSPTASTFSEGRTATRRRTTSRSAFSSRTMAAVPSPPPAARPSSSHPRWCSAPLRSPTAFSPAFRPDR